MQKIQKREILPACNASPDTFRVTFCCSPRTAGLKSHHWWQKCYVSKGEEEEGERNWSQVLSVIVFISWGKHLKYDERVKGHNCTDIDDMVEEWSNIWANVCHIIVTSIGSTSPNKFTCCLEKFNIYIISKCLLNFTPMISGKRAMKETIHNPKPAT